MLEFILPPLVASVVIVAIHSYLGLHILARGVIFVDLALAQMAALGITVALLVGVDHDSPTTLMYALAFTTFGALLFSVTRTERGGRVPQEAIIGLVFVIASALSLLVADHVPEGGEAIKEVMVGNLLWVTWPVILRLAGIYLVLGVIQYALRQRFITISMHPDRAQAQGWRIKWWDFLFYLLFGITITFSVQIVGVLLVFSFLVVPAAAAFQFTDHPARLTMIAWLVGLIASAAGIAASFNWDLPTGPVVVASFGLTLVLAWILKRLLGRDTAREGSAPEPGSA